MENIENTENTEKNCELLFDYLKSILYDPKTKPLDLDALDPSFVKLGKGLQYLEHAIKEMRTYSEALSRGNLSCTIPARDNPLCANLKNIHSNLNHLTWQAKQVAKGDYSQTVSYLGEFSEAFNSMTRQLEEREEALKKEAENQKTLADQMEVEALQDTLTAIGNRHFFETKIHELLSSGEEFIFCYCDLDHLKYVNDRYGHLEGDWYIRYFVQTIQNYIRKDDLFARIGGDEFCIILRNCPKEMAQEKIHRMQDSFSHYDLTKPYAKSFSCGIIEISADHDEIKVDDLLQKADAIMYQQKQLHKEIYARELP